MLVRKETEAHHNLKQEGAWLEESLHGSFLGVAAIVFGIFTGVLTCSTIHPRSYYQNLNLDPVKTKLVNVRDQ